MTFALYASLAALIVGAALVWACLKYDAEFPRDPWVDREG
jgi:hypothetical protein